ncbi:MAG: hypothetical protein ACI7YS_07665 [Flavobacterium sp.]
MTTTTILLILVSILIATGLSFYQYFYKTQNRNKIHWVLAVLRFFVVFAILILLINPKITRNSVETEKTPLAIVVDNSGSVADLKADKIALELYQKISSNKDLNEKFDIQSFKFDSETELSESFDFKGKQTNLELVAKNLKNNYKNKKFPTVLISDGNQTQGDDYVYNFDENNKVYPLILGDTTTFLDLKITQLNVNKYVFHKNKFPVEVFLQYAGTKNISADFSIFQGNNVISKQNVSFSPNKKTALISVLLPAKKIGLQIFKAAITSKATEKNTYNNVKNFAVEIIDQRSEIALISTLNHPDLGALKRSIESNSQRKVIICNPNEIKSLQNFNLLIFYQPNSDFRTVFEQNKAAGINTFIITGTKTDFSFLNQQQSNFSFNMSNQKEDYSAGFDSKFNLFAIDNFGFESFPPLQNAFGAATINGNAEVLLSSSIRNVATNFPLLSFFENQGKRSAFLLGENSWKWRMFSHVANKSYDKYDIFIDKIVQYLISNNSKKSLVVNHENFYNSGESLEITAQYFNKNYEFDENARLTISVINKKTKDRKQFDLLRDNNAFKVNLDGLSAGQYQFSVKELNSNSVYNGYFEVLDFDIEKQFVNPDLQQLKQLANRTQSSVFMPNQVDDLIKKLLEDQEYKTIQKSKTIKLAIIDWESLLIGILILLSFEWFIRKYNGML